MDNSQLFLATRKYSDVDVDDQHKQIFEDLAHTIPRKFKVVSHFWVRVHLQFVGSYFM